MTIYEKAKSLVTAREAAEHYGLTVNSRGMAVCPLHDDHNPSMKLDERFHCFGCGEDGDVIDFTAKFFNLTLREAAQKLIDDFGDGVFIPEALAPPKPPDPARRCHNVLLDLEIRLHRQKRETAPQSMDDPITTEYAQNCQMYDFIVCLADLLSGGTEKEKAEAISYLTGGVLDCYSYARFPQIWYIELLLVYSCSIFIVYAVNKKLDSIENHISLPFFKYLRG